MANVSLRLAGYGRSESNRCVNEADVRSNNPTFPADIGLFDLTPDAAMEGVNIDWVNDTNEGSIQAASALAKASDIVYPPALYSRHTAGAAMDLTITNYEFLIEGTFFIESD